MGHLLVCQAHWTPAQQSMDIIWKELYAIVIAVYTWGPSWQRQKQNKSLS